MPYTYSFDGSSMIPLDEVDAPHTTGQHEHRRAASYSGRPQHQHRNMAGSAPGRRGSLFVGAGGQVLETPQSAAAAAASTAHGLFSSPDVVVAPIARRTPTGRHSVPTVPISAHAHLDLYQPHQQHIPTDPLHIAEGASAADQLEFMFQQSDVLSQAPTSYAGSVYAPTLSARNHGSTNGGSIGLPSIAERPAPEAHADILHWLDGSTHLEAFQQPATMQADDSLPIAARTRKHHPSPRKPPPGNDDTLESRSNKRGVYTWRGLIYSTISYQQLCSAPRPAVWQTLPTHRLPRTRSTLPTPTLSSHLHAEPVRATCANSRRY